LIEHAPQCGNLDRQIIVFDHDPGPCGGHDLIPRDELARPLEQHPEHIERPRADFHRS